MKINVKQLYEVFFKLKNEMRGSVENLPAPMLEMELVQDETNPAIPAVLVIKGEYEKIGYDDKVNYFEVRIEIVDSNEGKAPTMWLTEKVEIK